MVEVVSLAGKLAQFDEQWSPKIIAEMNGSHVKVAKVQGEFVWHSHDAEDELFLVVRGRASDRATGWVGDPWAW